LIDAGYDPLDYRYFLLGGHYRSQLQFSFEGLDGARNARRSLREKTAALAKRASGAPPPDSGGAADSAAGYLAAFQRALEDDLSTPRALAELWGLLRDTGVPPPAALAAVLDMDRVLGLRLAEAADTGDGAEAGEIESLIAERGAAKKLKDYVRADAIREQLRGRGVVLEDGPGGTVWRRQG
ncbi:MAG: cysteine--tRNA ligase, partial [Spirochaetaceae bacterium]|nr:cysteine--tRNA ligase [Spirochaetaceae bacterium]